jgi:hypothetical protein
MSQSNSNIVTEKINTIKTDSFNNFIWKRLPIEHEYITIAFCVSDFKTNSDNSNDLNDFLNKDVQKLLQYVLNIMPFKCILNVDNYKEFIEFNKDKEDKKPLKNIIDNIHEYDYLEKNELEQTEKNINKLNNKKTYIFTYTDNEEDENKILKNIFDISINEHFSETHKICIGEIKNIPKNILSISDYIFFENKDILNQYLEQSNHNIRINTTNSSVYLIDKCNYEYFHLFLFNKHNP